MSQVPHSAPSQLQPAALVRGVSLPGAIALNMNNMIGVGPFITLPLVIAAMGGPQAILAWVLGAILAAADGLVWAELGASMPSAGGSYKFLQEIYGPGTLGKYLAFLFIWQLTFSAPLSIASGCVGLAHYAGYVFPSLRRTLIEKQLVTTLPLLGQMHFGVSIGYYTFVAMGCCLLAVFLLYRSIASVSSVSRLLWVGVIFTLGSIIFAGFTHFHPSMITDLPAGTFQLSHSFFQGLGLALLIATYDYWGAYNVCFLGAEIKSPGYIIPRAIIWSVACVAILYLLLNISVLGVIPWREIAMQSTPDARLSVVALVMRRAYGKWAGQGIALLVIWTAFASVFALLLAYSRVPYAAACDGNYFKVFARLHPRYRFPHYSLLVLAALTVVFCTLSLADLIAALVVIRIILQFLLQQIGVIVYRIRRPDAPRPFRLWLYPLPPLLAAAGFFYILFGRANFQREIVMAGVIALAGSAVFVWRQRRKSEFSPVGA